MMSSYNDPDITRIRICYNPSTGDYEVLVGSSQIFKYFLKRILNILLNMLLCLISCIPSIIKIIIDDIKCEFFWKEVIEIPDKPKEIKYENTNIDIINVRSIDNTMVQKQKEENS